MPLAKIVTSAPAPAEAERLLADVSKLLARELQKPEAYVMTCLEPRAAMTFGGTTEPSAYLEIKSIGRFTPEKTRALSQALCTLVGSRLGVPPERVYIEFSDATGYLWGHAGDTF